MGGRGGKKGMGIKRERRDWGCEAQGGRQAALHGTARQVGGRARSPAPPPLILSAPPPAHLVRPGPTCSEVCRWLAKVAEEAGVDIFPGFAGECRHPNLTSPHRSALRLTAPHRIAPLRTAPHLTSSHLTSLDPPAHLA